MKDKDSIDAPQNKCLQSSDSMHGTLLNFLNLSDLDSTTI